MAKKVVLLTNRFPYGIVETFIEEEIASLPAGVELILFPIQKHSPSDKGREVPDNITVDNTMNMRPRAEYWLKAFEVLFSPRMWRALIHANKKGLRDRIRVIGFYARAKQISDIICRKYGEELKANKAVLYSYWMGEGAMAISTARNRTCSVGVTRAHRTDLYDGNCVYGIVPGQKDTISGLNRIYPCSQDGRTYLQKKYPSLQKKISYSYLGTRDYGYTPGDNRGGEFMIASCSRLVPVKRVHLLAEALASIKDLCIHWVHIGDGPERDNVEGYISSLPDNIKVTLTGNLSHDDVMNYYKKHSINLFVNVSHSEGLPVSIMEVASFGIPIIATDVGGTGEIVDKSIGDLMPEDFTKEQLEKLIRKYVLMNSDDYSKQRDSVRKYWENNFYATNNYRKFYEEITQM